MRQGRKSTPYESVCFWSRDPGKPLPIKSSRNRALPKEEQAQVLAFVAALDIKEIATKVIQKLFAMLEMKFDFKLSRDGGEE